MAETREMTTREAGKRRAWQPRAMLETPDPPPGYKYRWIRHEVRGQDDTRNIVGRQREGYELVRADEVPEEWRADVCTDGIAAGVVRNGDLVLARVPEEFVEQRTQYIRERTRRQQEAVDSQLMQHQNTAMPISRDNRSSVTRGRPNFEEG